MKEGNIHIALPQPCHERWEEMTPEGRGRHCAACSKTVIDFTVMTDGEIATIFVATGNDLPCGGFLDIQLNRSLAFSSPKQQSALAYWAKRVAAILLLTPILPDAYAQKNVAQPIGKHQVRQPERAIPKLHTVKGQVLDNMTRQPVAGVRLSIATLQLDTVTDHKGHFVFVLPDGATITNLTIASPYNVGDSFVVMETAVSDSEVRLGQDVILYRHEVQRLNEHAVITHEVIRARPYSGVPVIERIELPPRKRGLRGIFKRKHS